MRLLLALVCVAASAQTSQVFEAADVHVSPAGASESAGFLPGGRVEFRATTLARLISVAWSIPQIRVTGGPPWLETDRFDLIAKAAGPTPQIAMRILMQGLLADRFSLVVKQGDRPQPVLALVPGKGNPPKESTSKADPSCQRGMEDNIFTMTCRNTTLASLADSLPNVAPGYFNRLVLDKSGLEGHYDFTLRWVGRGQLPPGGGDNELSLITAVVKHFGVKVEAQTAPMPVVEIVSANRVPTANPPGVTEMLGPEPTEFDVADLKMSAPGAKENFIISNGLLRVQAVPLSNLIQFAWNVGDDGVRSEEKWLGSERFDITAKTAPTASEDVLRTMVKSLLIERFGLKTHAEVQPVNVLALTAVKPKLSNADQNRRSTCRMEIVTGARELACTNVTMAQFIERLPGPAAGYVDRPVVDLTGLRGSYDFVLSWTPARIGSGGRGSGDATALPTAELPTGLTLFEAIEKQLGLKLAARKHPMPVVVIDHVERKPTAN